MVELLDNENVDIILGPVSSTSKEVLLTDPVNSGFNLVSQLSINLWVHC